MKIYSKVEWDRDGTVLVEESFEYEGEVALRKGGGSTTTTVDKDFNRRMASIYEEQQDWAGEYMDFWRTEQKGLDSAKIKAQQDILPYQTEHDIAQFQSATVLYPHQTENQIAKLTAETGLIPQQTELAKQQMTDRSLAITQNAPVREKFLSEATKGVNINDRMGQATADVAQSFKDAGMQTQRGLSRMGVTPSASATAANMNATNLARAKANAGGRGLSRVGAEKENFSRLQAGSQYGLQATGGGV
jgi:hypothetical protein